MAATPTTPAAAQESSKAKIIKFLTKNSMTIALIAVFVLFYFLTGGRLLYAQNMSNLLLQNGYVLVLACGMLLCILTGGNIDLSVGSVICLTGGLAAVLSTNRGWNAYITVLLCLLVGLVVGIWQGYWIGYVRIPPFITTLAGMFIWRGMGRLVLDSKTVPIKDKAFTNLFTSYINIPGLDVISTKAKPVDNPHIWSPLVIGAMLLGVLNMGMSIMGITDSWQYVVKGGVLLVAVIFDVVSSRKSGK